jgi:hypothetical protein
MLREILQSIPDLIDCIVIGDAVCLLWNSRGKSLGEESPREIALLLRSGGHSLVKRSLLEFRNGLTSDFVNN